jgi:hypothetical protein
MRHDKNDVRLVEGKRLRAIRPTHQGGLLAVPDHRDARSGSTASTPLEIHGDRLPARRPIRLSCGLDCQRLSKGGFRQNLYCVRRYSAELFGRCADDRGERYGFDEVRALSGWRSCGVIITKFSDHVATFRSSPTVFADTLPTSASTRILAGKPPRAMSSATMLLHLYRA